MLLGSGHKQYPDRTPVTIVAPIFEPALERKMVWECMNGVAIIIENGNAIRNKLELRPTKTREHLVSALQVQHPPPTCQSLNRTLS